MFTGNGTYILDANGEPVQCLDLETWGRWMEDGHRILRQDWVDRAKHIVVSTVFLGLDHRFSDRHGPRPILWETMVFGTPLDGEMNRYTSKADALAGHAEMLARVQAEWRAISDAD